MDEGQYRRLQESVQAIVDDARARARPPNAAATPLIDRSVIVNVIGGDPAATLAHVTDILRAAGAGETTL